jgi:hypothetical protein
LTTITANGGIAWTARTDARAIVGNPLAVGCRCWERYRAWLSRARTAEECIVHGLDETSDYGRRSAAVETGTKFPWQGSEENAHRLNELVDTDGAVAVAVAVAGDGKLARAASTALVGE